MLIPVEFSASEGATVVCKGCFDSSVIIALLSRFDDPLRDDKESEGSSVMALLESPLPTDDTVMKPLEAEKCREKLVEVFRTWDSQCQARASSCRNRTY